MMGNIPENARGRVGVLNRHLSPQPTLSTSNSSNNNTNSGDQQDWKILYTLTDEAPLLATYSFFPIIQRFTKPHGINVQLSDISVANRILALFPDQKVPDTLHELGELTADKTCNIIKLPNVSASLPQLIAAIAELQGKGYKIPNYEDPEAKKLYQKVLGSAVNPVLREGNSDRRVAPPVKEDAKKHPHRMMKPYPKDSKSKVVHMDDGDFYGSEKSAIMPKATVVSFEFIPDNSDGKVVKLREDLKLQEHEVIDASVMNVQKLREFLSQEMLNSDTMISLHLKATMMKVSDPIMFGHAVSIFYEEVFHRHAATFKELGINANNGIGDVYAKLKTAKISDDLKKEILADIENTYKNRPEIAMVNSDKGITNLHVPSDIIIDASMPVVVRDGGKMYARDGSLKDVKCIIPDRCYATIYKRVLEFCKENGEFDPTTMGSVSNVGLMARKAEEYGSHDKTFEIPSDGVVIIRDIQTGKKIFEHGVQCGDIYRACQAKDDAIIDWISLALKRSELTSTPVIFWLDENRAHDRSLIDIINFSTSHSIKTTAQWKILPPELAMQETLERSKKGLDTISATGNVLRDYLTDLFPILELGTSAKMLSIVPLLAGGGLYETGAGGSAPKHVEQFLHEGHLRWDSLGEFLALSVSLTDLGDKSGNKNARIIGDALMAAVGKFLEAGKSPGRKVMQNDNRGSHFWLALFWAKELAESSEAGTKLKADFLKLAALLEENKDFIDAELKSCQGKPEDVGGYYLPDPAKAEKAMRPCKLLNDIIGG